MTTTSYRGLHPVIEVAAYGSTAYTSIPSGSIIGDVTLTEGAAVDSLAGQPRPEPARLTATILRGMAGDGSGSLTDDDTTFDPTTLITPGSGVRFRMAASGDGGTPSWHFTGHLVARDTEVVGSDTLYHCEWASPLHHIVQAQGSDMPYPGRVRTATQYLRALADDAGLPPGTVTVGDQSGQPAHFVRLPRGGAGIRTVQDLGDGLVLDRCQTDGSPQIQLVTWTELASSAWRQRRVYTDTGQSRGNTIALPAAIWHQDPWAVITAVECQLTGIAPARPRPIATRGVYRLRPDGDVDDAIDEDERIYVLLDHDHVDEDAPKGHTHLVEGSTDAGGTGESQHSHGLSIETMGTLVQIGEVLDWLGDEKDKKPDQDGILSFPDQVLLTNFDETMEDKDGGYVDIYPTGNLDANPPARGITPETDSRLMLADLEEREYDASPTPDAAMLARYGRREAAQPIRFAVVNAVPLPANWPGDNLFNATVQEMTAIGRKILDRYKTPQLVFELQHRYAVPFTDFSVRNRRPGQSERLELKGYSGVCTVMRMETRMIHDDLVLQRVWYRPRFGGSA